MSWVRFDDGFFRHPKVVTAGRDARDLFMASVFYANSNLTDGFIPEGALRMITADAAINSHAKPITALLKVGLWKEADGGYQIHDYLEYQTSAASVAASRAANAERQAEYRRRNGMRNANSNGVTHSVTNASNNGAVTTPPINIPITTTNSGELVDSPNPPKPKPAKAKPAENPAPDGTVVTEHPFTLFEAMCEQTGLDPADVPTRDKSKQLAVAKRLVESGTSSSDVKSITRWLKSQEWRTGGVDLFIVEKEHMRWLSEGKPDGSKPVATRKPPANLQTNKERNDKSTWVADWPEYTG